jgi:hypothetical protein
MNSPAPIGLFLLDTIGLGGGFRRVEGDRVHRDEGFDAGNRFGRDQHPPAPGNLFRCPAQALAKSALRRLPTEHRATPFDGERLAVARQPLVEPDRRFRKVEGDETVRQLMPQGPADRLADVSMHDCDRLTVIRRRDALEITFRMSRTEFRIVDFTSEVDDTKSGSRSAFVRKHEVMKRRVHSLEHLNGVARFGFRQIAAKDEMLGREFDPLRASTLRWRERRVERAARARRQSERERENCEHARSIRNRRRRHPTAS